MARAIWKGHITFGLVNIPVNLYSAEQRTDLQLHMLDSRDNTRVRYERVNEETGEEVPWNTIVKGYEYKDGHYVVVSDEELKRAAPEATRAIEIEHFVALEEIDPIFFDKPYYLEPAKGGAKGYALLRDALRDSGRVGIARVVIRTRQYISSLISRNDMLLLVLLRYAQEIRKPTGLELPGSSTDAKVSPIEKKTARMLLDGMTTRWHPEAYHDEYRDELQRWIEKRVRDGHTDKPAELPEVKEEASAGPIDFMELLKKSLEHKGHRQKALPEPQPRRGSGDASERAPARRGTAAKPRPKSGASRGSRRKAPARRKAG